MLALLHLSDIHIDSNRHPVLRRIDAIAQAVSSTGRSIEHLAIVITGDIAQSGTEAQYQLAADFLGSLADKLKVTLGCPSPQYVFVPGNHDCDLKTASDIRQLEFIETQIDDLDPNGALASAFLQVQSSFFQFAEQFEGTPFKSSGAKLCHSRLLNFDGKQLCFYCFNTAWLTQNPERPSKLFFPISAMAELETPSTADLTIAAFHHPYNWLNPTNAHAFKAVIEKTADLMLSGHEHEPDIYIKQRATDNLISCVEAGALWEPKARTSAFNVIMLDFANDVRSIVPFNWHEGTYYPRKTAWEPITRNRTAHPSRLENSQDFRQKLNELGMGFNHRNSLKDLSLSDLFVYPDLVKRVYAVRTRTTTKHRVRSESVVEHIYGLSRVLLVGDAKSGKTSLARSLYADLKTRSLYPLMITGRQLRGNEHRILAELDRSFAEQYSPDTLQLFKQLPKEQKVLIVDGFDLSGLSAAAYHATLAVLHRLAGRVILLVDEAFYAVIELSITGPDRPFAAYEHLEILPFCPSLRNTLISKWVQLGADEDASFESITYETRIRSKVIDRFLPKQALPAYPINVLGLLQAFEAHANLNTASGSYGELCEALITQRLLAVTKPDNLARHYALLSRLAYFLFRNDRKVASTQDLAFIKRDYFEAYDIEFDLPTLISNLQTAHLIVAVDNNYRFTHAPYYYFFVARYLKDAAADPADSQDAFIAIRSVADHLYYEPYVNILIFYLYFTHDIPLIEYLLDSAKRIYSECPDCSFENDVAFLNRLYIEAAKPICIGQSDLNENRIRQQDQADEAELEAQPELPENSDRDITYDRELDHLKKMNIAFKTLQILGQVLRDFPNVLKKDVKTRVAHGCYSLGLRVMSAILTISEENLEGLRQYFSMVIKEHRKIVIDSDLASETDTFMIRLIGACSYGVILRIAGSVGAEELAETYRNVLKMAGDTISVGLVDLCIKLEHFQSFPVEEIEGLSRRLTQNRFAYGLLRELVINRLIFEDIGLESRRRIGKLLRIDIGEITDGVKFLHR